MKRTIILIMDSFGIGASQDAEKYGDVGSDTFGHIVEKTGIQLPNLARRGLIAAHLASTGKKIEGLVSPEHIDAKYGYAVEQSAGKDTPSGHWEIAGLPVMYDWGYFPTKCPCFPDKLIQDFIAQTNLPGVLGNKHASGTEIIEELGQAHIQSGKPIVYTSADSVFQIAAHEEHFGLERLYEICDITRKLVDEYNIGRVIARPFIGEPGSFNRTANRRDYTTSPHADTLLDAFINADRKVIAIGKIADIFAQRGISQIIKGTDNMDLFDKTLDAVKQAPDGSVIFTNFVDFDSKYGHRRNVQGYADALTAFDKRLPELDAIIDDDDMVVISADHGCDPTQPGSDHTREHIPVIVYGKTIQSGFVGRRETFADIGQTIAQYMDLPALDHGVAF